MSIGEDFRCQQTNISASKVKMSVRRIKNKQI
jgi:hypothetical protein